MKECTKCKIIKANIDFYKDKRIKSGLTSWCKECHGQDYKDNHERYKQYRQTHKTKLNKRTKIIRNRNISSWKLYFCSKHGDNPQCAVCGYSLTWSVGNKQKSVHFDHRHNGTAVIQGIPSKFCEGKPCTKENIAIWESCDFGILCNQCNRVLPTKDREQWLRGVLKYVHGPKTGIVTYKDPRPPSPFISDWDY